MTARIPDPHILLTVVAGTDLGTPAAIAAWRAGAWPWPAGSTQPMIVSLTMAASAPADSSAPLIAAEPSAWPETLAKAPSIAPIGVRRALRMTTESRVMIQFLRI